MLTADVTDERKQELLAKRAAYRAKLQAQLAEARDRRRLEFCQRNYFNTVFTKGTGE